MNHTRLVFHWVVLLTMLAAPASLADCCGPGGGSDPLCGPKSLLLICSELGVAADLDELAQLAEATETGTTLGGLRKAATQKGLQAVGLKIGVGGLSEWSGLAICHLWGDHFVVVESDGAGAISVTDSSSQEGQQKVPLDDFKAAYSGFALLLSRQPITPPGLDAAVPDVRFESYFHDLGSVEEGSQTDRVLMFRNAGEQELIISQARPSCTCLEVESLTERVAPGGEGRIALTFDATGLRGGQMYHLFVESNDPVSPLAVVEVVALVKPSSLLVSRRRVYFGEVDASLGATREIFVKDPGDGSLRITDVVAESPNLGVLLGGKAISKPEVEETVFPVQVTLEPGLPVGPFEGAITIISNHPKEPRVQIPVVAMVKGDIEVSPEALFLGFAQEGQILSKSVSLRARTPRAFSIENVCTSPDLFSVEISPKAGGREYVATVSLKETAPAGLVKGEVHFHTDSPLQPTVTVPVSAFVQAEPTGAPARVGVGSRSGGDREAVVRMYVFRSDGCSHCKLVDASELQALARRVGCRIETKYFDVEDVSDFRRLTDLERRFDDTGNSVPVVFVGDEVFGGEEEVAAFLEAAVARYAAEGGAAWPD
ncbi:MAG TPA: DUF1573 domain-containing protein [Anaerolineae bacterium]|nr:DUF1573 domain-containing protein [Anaerolineae bacterium]